MLSDQVNLLIPGLGMLPKDCAHIVRVFVRHGMRIHIFDTQAFLHGKKENYRQNILAGIDAFIKENGKINCLIGYSLGAAIALEYVIDNADKVKQLILSDPLLQPIQNYSAGFINCLQDMFADCRDSNFALKKLLFYAEYMMRVNLIFRGARLVKSLKCLENQNFLIETKTTFLWGENDRICPFRNYSIAKDCFKKHRLITIPNVGHAWMLNNALIEKYVAFLVLGKNRNRL
ncbi:MAG: alpha/beta hydrolase [Patescibacteria group bacterium]|nr:alpha/beta hydrolase [Patescibacteria group bacterium]